MRNGLATRQPHPNRLPIVNWTDLTPLPTPGGVPERSRRSSDRRSADPNPHRPRRGRASSMPACRLAHGTKARAPPPRPTNFAKRPAVHMPSAIASAARGRSAMDAPILPSLANGICKGLPLPRAASIIQFTDLTPLPPLHTRTIAFNASTGRPCLAPAWIKALSAASLKIRLNSLNEAPRMLSVEISIAKGKSPYFLLIAW